MNNPAASVTLFAIVNGSLYLWWSGDEPLFYPELFDPEYPAGLAAALWQSRAEAQSIIDQLGRRKGIRQITGLKVHRISRVLQDEGEQISDPLPG